MKYTYKNYVCENKILLSNEKCIVLFLRAQNSNSWPSFLGYNMSKFNVCAQMYMLLGSLSCLYLDLHVCTCIYIPMIRSMCSCAPCHACAQIYVVFLKPFPPLISLFLVFWPFWQGVDLDNVVQAQIYTPSPILKGLDHFLCMSMFACLFLCFISMLGFLDIGFAMLCALYGLVLVWSHSSLLRIDQA